MQTIGIDFGGTSVKIGVCEQAKILAHYPRIPTPEFDSPASLLVEMVRAVGLLRDRFPDVAAIGVGVPGFVDWKTGIVHSLTNVPGWDRFPLRRHLDEATGLPVCVDNDANTVAYAEWRLGSGQGSRNLVAVTLGTGVGGGLILENRLYRGSDSLAGEIGQISIDLHGRPGPYGNSGALERYIGNAQVTERAMAAYAGRGEKRERRACSPEVLAAAAGKGDPVALALWEEIASELATVLAGVVWLLNPDTIVVGGGIAGAGDILFEPLRRRLTGQLDAVFSAGLRVVQARFGSDAGILGAAILGADAVADNTVLQEDEIPSR